jgi:hypothetical protein
MGTLSIKTIPSEVIGEYRIERNHIFLRRDLYRFMDFVFGNDLKRSHRGNTIPKGPAKRLAKILSYNEEPEYVEEYGCGYWSDTVSQVARYMNLVKFDTKGKYMGYSSREPSYPENYIEPSLDSWNRYLALSSLEKEWAIWEGLNKATGNEFHRYPTLIADQPRFDSWGSAVNAASKMDLPKVRRGLLDILFHLEPNIWYSLSDMVAYLKKNHFDLIIDRKKRDRSTKENIYDCFLEYPIENKKQNWSEKREIREGETDAFERVEGRYLAFFLEEIPFIMGFVDLAFDDRISPSVSPFLGCLKAFSLTSKFFSVYGKDPSYNQVKVTVQPNHEVVVQYSGYAEGQLVFLQDYGSLIKDDQTLIFRLEKKRIADSVAAGRYIGEMIKRLKDLSSAPIPQNILTEMEHWGSHGDKITLYRGYSLLEIEPGRSKEQPDLKGRLSGQIEREVTPSLLLIKDGKKAFHYLEGHGYLPQEFNHVKAPFLYDQETHSRLKAAPVKRKKKVECGIAFKEFSVMECEKREILVEVEKQLQKKAIPLQLFPEKGMLLVPLPYMKIMEAIAKKAIEKSTMIMKIIE